RPGVLWPSQARSIDVASQLVKFAYSASGGRGMPGGGIARTLSFRRTLSQVPALPTRSSKLAASRLTGPSAGCAERVLWQETPYLFNHARYLTAAAAVLPADGAVPGDVDVCREAGSTRGLFPVWAISAVTTPKETKAAGISIFFLMLF